MPDLAHLTAPHTQLYLDGRFYICISRQPLDRDRLNDIIILQRISLADKPSLARPVLIYASELLDAELEGRAALIGPCRPVAVKPNSKPPRQPFPTHSEAPVMADVVFA